MDDMLASMTVRQYNEWLAFFKIRNEDRPHPGGGGNKPQRDYGASPEGQKQMSAAILQAMTGYQQRRDRMKQ